MAARVTFDMANAEKNFARVMDEISKFPGLDRRRVVLSEAGSVLKRCAALTKVAPKEKLDLSAKLRALKALKLTGGGQITINAGKKGPYGRVFIKKKSGTGYRRTHEADFAPLNQHYKAEQWEKLSNTIHDAQIVVERVTKDVVLSAGLARGSWIQIARSLGIDLAKVPGRGLTNAEIKQAEDSRGKGGQNYRNGLSREEDKNGSYFVTLINRLPYGRRIKLDSTLQAAIAGRVSFITTAMAKGAFDSVESAIKRFPRWQIKR